jgi:molybdenum cofactor cytidylyltransferase
MLRLNPAAVDRINAQEGVLLVCAEPNRPVDTGTTVAVVKCAPVLMPRKTVRAVEQIARELGPVVEVIPFQTMRVAFTAPADRLRGGAFEHAHSALAHALEWYGSRLDVIVASEATPEAMADTYRQACDHGVELILAAGAAATDPLDLVFDALHMAGGEVLQIGIPAEPGTACWIGRLGSTGVLGLASCELFGRPGALDLILPRLLSGERLDRDLVRGLGVGGLLLGPSRLAPYHAGHRAND